jgi:hypothetical protein
MSLIAAGSHTIFADSDGFVPTGIALCAVTPGDVVGEPDLELLPPHAPRTTASGTTTKELSNIRERIARQGTDRLQAMSVGGRVARVVVLVLVVAAGVGLGAGRADAHICPLAPEVTPGQLETVQVAVTVEGTPVPDVEVSVPPQLRLDRVDPSPGWTITQDGQTIHYKGPPIQPYTCQYFSIGVTALEKGVFTIPVTQRDANGTVVARSVPTGTLSNANPYLVQKVYAGVPVPSPSSGGGISGTVIAGVALIGIGAVAFAALGVRSWRARREDAREAEVDERVEAFKKQARDRSRGAPK